MRLSSKELCTLLLYGNNDFSYLVNRGVIEETIKYITSYLRIARQVLRLSIKWKKVGYFLPFRIWVLMCLF